MLHFLENYQSMGMLQAGFKTVKGMQRLMAQRFPALKMKWTRLPAFKCVTRETLAYAFKLSLSVWSVCFKSDGDMFKGTAATFYDKALKDLQGLADKDWERLVKDLLLQYVMMVTSPHPPGLAATPLHLSPPPMSLRVTPVQ